VIYELSKTDYEKARSLFHPLAWHLTSAAVLDGNNPGRVFVDDPANPQTAFMFSPEGCYLAGNPDNDAFNRALNHAIYTGEITGEKVTALFFVCHPESWEARLAALLDPWPPIAMQPRRHVMKQPRRHVMKQPRRHVMKRRHYACREVKYDWRANLPDDFAVHRINDALLNQAGLRIPDHVHSWMENNWGSTAGFLERGFGFATIHDDQVVSWSLTDCVSRDACEIGIRTAEAFQRRGLATITAAAAVEHALSNGIAMVGWHCPEDNHGSIGTAEKVGFEKERDYTMYYTLLDKTDQRQNKLEQR